MLLNLVVSLLSNPYHWSWLTFPTLHHRSRIPICWFYMTLTWLTTMILIAISPLTYIILPDQKRSLSILLNTISSSVLILLLILWVGFGTVQWTYHTSISGMPKDQIMPAGFLVVLNVPVSLRGSKPLTPWNIAKDYDSRKRLVQFSYIVTPLRSGVDQFCQCQVAGHCNGLGITFLR